MKNWILIMFVVVCTVTTLQAQQGRDRAPANVAMMQEGSAATYEALAEAIVAVRETETQLVKGILTHSYTNASRHLNAAMGAEGAARARHLEQAATSITDLANEGDKRIQAVRQRLLEAGHHHHTDAETQDDYIFIDSAEKKSLLDLATSVARLGGNATDEAIGGAADALTAAFESAMQDE